MLKGLSVCIEAQRAGTWELECGGGILDPIQGLDHMDLVTAVGRHPNCTEPASCNNTSLQPWG